MGIKKQKSSEETANKAAAVQNESIPWGQKLAYQEWECKISVNKETKKVEAEKLKMRRPRVLITEEQANILNESVMNVSNSLVSMYFLPE